MLDKLTRYIRGFGPPATSLPTDPPDSQAPGTRAAAGAWPRNPGVTGGPQEGWTVRDLVVEGAVAPALREVFAQERSRSGSGNVITLYDPQRAFPPVLPRLVEALRGTAGDRIRLIDSRSRKALAIIDRALLGAGGNVLRLLEVDISGVERPSPEVPLTLLEQSDVAAVLLGAQPDPTQLESLLMASLASTWRCANLLLLVPHDAPHARARLARYSWPAGARTEAISDAAAELPGLWTAALRRSQAALGGEAASHAERIGEMLAAVAVPPDGPPPAAPALSDVTIPMEPVTSRSRDEPAAAAAVAPPASAVTQQAARAAPRPALAPWVREPGITVGAALSPTDPRTEAAAAAGRVGRPAAGPPVPAPGPSAAGDAVQQTLEPLMRLPGAIATATLDLRDARLTAQLGAADALAAAQPDVLLGCKPLALAPAHERRARVDEWIWTAGGRVHVLQPLPHDPLRAVLVIVDADRADLPMTRWACTVARNGIDQQGAAGAATHALRAETVQGASSVR
jgi:hypothetical protein